MACGSCGQRRSQRSLARKTRQARVARPSRSKILGRPSRPTTARLSRPVAAKARTRARVRAK